VNADATAPTSPARIANPMLALQRRAFGVGGADTAAELGLAVLGPLAAVLVCWGRVPAIGFVAAAAIPAPILLALVAVRLRSRWAAQDVLGWMDHAAAAEWRESTGSRMPRNSVGAGEWLRAHSENDVRPDLWVAALLMAGRVAEAREGIARLPVETPRQHHRRLDLETAADAADGRPIGSAAADDAVGHDQAASQAERAVHLAYHAAVAAVGHGTDGLPDLAAARVAIGRLPARLAFRLWLIRLRFAAISALFGAWLCAAIMVGLATAGGAVWL
jgi:hypothetical protein